MRISDVTAGARLYHCSTMGVRSRETAVAHWGTGREFIVTGTDRERRRAVGGFTNVVVGHFADEPDKEIRTSPRYLYGPYDAVMVDRSVYQQEQLQERDRQIGIEEANRRHVYRLAALLRDLGVVPAIDTHYGGKGERGVNLAKTFTLRLDLDAQDRLYKILSDQ